MRKHALTTSAGSAEVEAAEMHSLLAPLRLVTARIRTAPGQSIALASGIAIAVAFGGAIAVDGVIAADQSARAVLAPLGALDRTVAVTWQGPVSSQVGQQARETLARVGLGTDAEVVLMNPVRLSGVVVRLAGIAPLRAWVAASRHPGPCLGTSCPMLAAGGAVGRSVLLGPGARIEVVGSARLLSAAPLGFSPTPAGQPLLVTGDVAGLSSLSGLSGIYRTHSWLAELPVHSLHSWNLAALEARLSSAQRALLASASQFTLSAPFSAIDSARAQAAAAPRRLLLTGGGVIAVLVMFIVLAAGGLRREVEAELQRIRSAGATSGQCTVFVLGEAAWVATVAIVLGAVLAIAAGAVLAHASGASAGPILAHSLVTVPGLAAFAAGWLCATAVMAAAMAVSGSRVADLLATVAVGGLIAVVAFGPDLTGDDTGAVLIAPLCCLAAAIITFRLAASVLRAGEHAARRGPPLVRLALVGLARAPTYPSLAIAFVAVSTSLGGFALAYRATLLRGAADQAANQVPLDAIVAPGSSFVTPLELASLPRWRELSGGTPWPIRRTDASYVSGGGSVTIPALGVPAVALPDLRGWRTSDTTAPLRVLARRLAPPVPVRGAGPTLPAGTRMLSLRLSSPAVAVTVTAELRRTDGTIDPVFLGSAGPRPTTLTTRIPSGTWELSALQLDEPAGLEITNAHQNGENPAAATQFAATVTLGPIRALDPAGKPHAAVRFERWRGVGAARLIRDAGTAVSVRFDTSGVPGVLRPIQPSDLGPLPVFVDPRTASIAGPSGQLSLTVDGQPVNARVVGALRRFPTVPSGAAGFVVADQARLASALDAQLPGQGRPDELWIAARDMARLRRGLTTRDLAQLSATYRGDLEHQLRSAPIARAVLGTLIAAAALSGILALLGLLVSLLGPARDRRVEGDLVAQGLGPSALRRELRLRMLAAAGLGVFAGVAVALALTRLSVAAVRGAGTVAVPQPPLVTVAPWLSLALWALIALAAFAALSAVAARAFVGRGAPR